MAAGSALELVARPVRRTDRGDLGRRRGHGDRFRRGAVEGHPARNKEGGTKIGIAAASKLYFEVAPANVFVGLYYRLLTFWRNSQPWSNIIAITLVVGLVLSFIRRNFDLDFKLAKKSKTKAKDE